MSSGFFVLIVIAILIGMAGLRIANQYQRDAQKQVHKTAIPFFVSLDRG